MIEALRNEKRMPLPKNFEPHLIVDLMNECWKEDPHERPSFDVIYKHATTLIIETHFFYKRKFLFYLKTVWSLNQRSWKMTLLHRLVDLLDLIMSDQSFRLSTRIRLCDITFFCCFVKNTILFIKSRTTFRWK